MKKSWRRYVNVWTYGSKKNELYTTWSKLWVKFIHKFRFPLSSFNRFSTRLDSVDEQCEQHFMSNQAEYQNKRSYVAKQCHITQHFMVLSNAAHTEMSRVAYVTVPLQINQHHSLHSKYFFRQIFINLLKNLLFSIENPHEITKKSFKPSAFALVSTEKIPSQQFNWNCHRNVFVFVLSNWNSAYFDSFTIPPMREQKVK